MGLNYSLIKSSYSKLNSSLATIFDQTCEKIRNSTPESNQLFEQLDPIKQKKKIISSLNIIIANLSNKVSLIPYLRKLGQIHLEYGIQEEHYAMIGKAFLSVLRQHFETQWTTELEEQWILTLGMVADQMLEGAKKLNQDLKTHSIVKRSSPLSTASSSDDLTQIARQIARNLLSRALEEQLDADLIQTARQKIFALLTQIMTEESAKVQNHLIATQNQLSVELDASKSSACS